MKRYDEYIIHEQDGFIPGMQGGLNIWKSISIIHHMNTIKEKKPVVLAAEEK